jgi:hypothetical protein
MAILQVFISIISCCEDSLQRNFQKLCARSDKIVGDIEIQEFLFEFEFIECKIL